MFFELNGHLYNLEQISLIDTLNRKIYFKGSLIPCLDLKQNLEVYFNIIGYLQDNDMIL